MKNKYNAENSVARVKDLVKFLSKVDPNLPVVNCVRVDKDGLPITFSLSDFNFGVLSFGNESIFLAGGEIIVDDNVESLSRYKANCR